MNVTEIIDALSGEITARGLYIVDVSVSKDNDIEVIIEKEVIKEVPVEVVLTTVV